MTERTTLDAYLTAWAGADATRGAVSETIHALMGACTTIADIVGHGALEGAMGAATEATNAGGDSQKALDLRTHDIVVAALKDTPVARIGSEEADDEVVFDDARPLVVATDPLDGSSNIETNVSIGTLFGILPNTGEASFLQPGSKQLAAGFVVYGPATVLVLTVGAGTQVFTLERDSGDYVLTDADVAIARETKEYAINASNQRHWDAAVQGYVMDCLAGVEGPREKNFNMRWVGSLVADVFRILVRGGVYLYPGDDRSGYAQGRLRLVYECNPIAFVCEQAGGAATTGTERVLDVIPASLHVRSPLVAGSAEEVERVTQYYAEPPRRSPLFAKRGLFLA
ncbi:fructose-1,6-bisphosphatase I [Methylopila capsulata]|uniref:Fructose-1,6-bisphosphatase class 1 n=1 Tax=Methylopila capsulata TaxID=61654 RepID=A0A9W6IT61_9HYPH|nr:class 1 fructose-bisphosphatase [Methylopila capsulata]MBM7849839.1 fructose-1,6-bisphosphatase I [Methylopila capsulata]GLK55129.1 fructose-1,6-bisphosphatase class 1 [Methylopila capsulata]